MQLAPRPNPLHFIRAAPVVTVRWFGLPTLLTRCLAGLPAFSFQTEPLVMVVAGIGGKPIFAASAFSLMMFHKNTTESRYAGSTKKLKIRSSVAEKFGTRTPVGFCSRTPSVPRASIIWLAPAVKVERSFTPRLHLDRVRYAIGWHLGITLGVCMSGFEKWMAQGCNGNCGSGKSVEFYSTGFKCAGSSRMSSNGLAQ
jgi:hypothetical protein